MKLVESIMTKNPCYTAGRTIAVKGLMLHSVGCPQPKASVFINAWNKASYNSACVHAFIDGNDGTVYQTLPWDRRGWHCGGAGNNTHIGVEMCESACIKYTGGSNFTCSDIGTARAVAKRTYDAAVELFAMLCQKYGLDPLADGVVISHSEGYQRGIASNHGDPVHLWRQLGLGYTMDQFRKDVKRSIMKHQDQPMTSQDQSTTSQDSTDDTGGGKHTSNTSDVAESVWNALYAAIGNAYGVAGLMGNLYAESGLVSSNLQNSGNKALGMTDEKYTEAVDNGSYPPDAFIHDGYGYGLAQWTHSSRKASLLAYALDYDKSIGDASMQIDFLLHEIKTYKEVWRVLTNATSVREASDAVLLNYERPANQDEGVMRTRASYGEGYYQRFTSTAASQEATIPHYYRVRESWGKPETQIGSFSIMSNAKAYAQLSGEQYRVYDWNGVQVWPEEDVFTPYKVRITVTDLNIREKATVDSGSKGFITPGVYTIIDEENGFGKLKSGAGYVALKYTKRI